MVSALLYGNGRFRRHAPGASSGSCGKRLSAGSPCAGSHAGARMPAATGHDNDHQGLSSLKGTRGVNVGRSITPFVCLALACAALAAPVAGQDQTYVINGTVVDEATQRPLASVSVTVSGTQFGTLSDQSGRFSLQARLAPGTYTLSYSLIGRGGATQEVTL